MNTNNTTLSSSDLLKAATGPLIIPMTNDYLFRAMLQSNNDVLKGLTSSLLHLPTDKIKSVVIDNPIELGKTIDLKTFFLDISLTLNDDKKISLEMQVINEHNWPERSLSYLCRSFDNIKAGDEYSSVKPAIQISILDFTLFPAYPEFYSTYQFLNVKNHTLYSDKLRLSVLDLTHIDLATDEDKSWQLDYWAALFKTKTWEDLKMLAEKNEYIQKAVETVYELTQDEDIRRQCQAREDFIRNQQFQQHRMDELTTENSQLKGTLSSVKEELSSLQLERNVFKLSAKGIAPEEIAVRLHLSLQEVTDILSS